MRSKVTYNNLNNVQLEEKYKEKPKKNIYELIDNSQILKKSAASSNKIPEIKDGKSQILKIFYDEDLN